MGDALHAEKEYFLSLPSHVESTPAESAGVLKWVKGKGKKLQRKVNRLNWRNLTKVTSLSFWRLCNDKNITAVKNKHHMCALLIRIFLDMKGVGASGQTPADQEEQRQAVDRKEATAQQLFVCRAEVHMLSD